jgi:hypothetical protein
MSRLCVHIPALHPEMDTFAHVQLDLMPIGDSYAEKEYVKDEDGEIILPDGSRVLGEHTTEELYEMYEDELAEALEDLEETDPEAFQELMADEAEWDNDPTKEGSFMEHHFGLATRERRAREARQAAFDSDSDSESEDDIATIEAELNELARTRQQTARQRSRHSTPRLPP